MKPLRRLAGSLAIALALLVAVGLGAAAALDLYRLIRPAFYRESYTRAPAFAGIAGAAERFREYDHLEVDYRPFVGWRYRPHRGPTITIDDDGLRVHAADPADPAAAPVVALFGGSSAWGMGVPDDGTLPAALDRLLPGVAVRNLGQTGYVSRQGLALLIERLAAGERFALALHYDGVNDVSALCRADVSLAGHGEEPVFRARLRPPASVLGRSLLQPVAELAALGRRKLLGPPPTPWTCAGEPARAAAVAEALLAHWEIAHAVAASRGVPLAAALQPVAYLGRPDLGGLDLTGAGARHPGLEREFLAVYPLIRERIAERGHPWIVDLTDALDGAPPVYFDFCHVTERGNERLARALRERLGPALALATDAPRRGEDG